MTIHTVRQGDSCFSVSEKYAVSPERIAEINSLTHPERLCVGQQLLILLPTRTYTVRRGDTVGSICHRFCIKKRILFANNPSLGGTEDLHVGHSLALRFETQKSGMTASNGYLFRHCPPEKLRAVLPYLTYVTADVARQEESCVRYDDRFDRSVRDAKRAGKTLLLRIRPSVDRPIGLPVDERRFFSEAVRIAKEHGFDGLTMASDFCTGMPARDFAAFILRMKKYLLGQDLILFTETLAGSDADCADVSDGNVLLFSKSHLPAPPAFIDGERAVFSAYARNFESSKAFLQIPCFGYDNEQPVPLSDIPALALSVGCDISTDPDTLLSSFRYRTPSGRRREDHLVIFDAPINVKAKLALAEEFGFMGTAFDIANVPTAVLMMIHAAFSEVDYCFGIPSESETV